MSDQWEHPADRRRRLARENDLFKGLRDRAAGKPEKPKDERSTVQREYDQARADAERRKPRS